MSMTDEHKKKLADAREAAKIAKAEQPASDKKEDTVTISTEQFNKMMKQLDVLQKNTDMLYRVADKGRLPKEMGKAGEHLIKQCKVSTWGDTGKMVMGWKLLTNRCEVVMGRWIEEQTASIVLEDEEVVTVPLIEFYRRTLKKIEADIISKSEEYDTDQNKVIMLKLQFPKTGKVIMINSSFIN